MAKRLLVCMMALLPALALCGCWNYRGLDQMDIVVGIAIDFDKERSLYKLCYEVVDVANAKKDGGINSILVESEGKTLFDAARNAKREEADRLFFGTAYLVVVSQEIAREMGILSMVEWFLRDGECRENMYVVISQKETAKEILERADGAAGIVSVTLQDILTEDRKVTGSAINKRLYEVFDALHSTRRSTMMAAVDKTQNGKREVCVLNGTAVCKGDRLAGFLTAEESKYALFAEDELKGGILTLSMAGLQADDISLEIFSTKTKRSFSHDGGKLQIQIKTHTDVAIAENHALLDVMDKQLVQRVEDAAAQMIEQHMTDLIAKMQYGFGVDLFGFGETIYKYDFQLWKQLEPSWEELFPTVKVTVDSKVRVTNSGFIK